MFLVYYLIWNEIVTLRLAVLLYLCSCLLTLVVVWWCWRCHY